MTLITPTRSIRRNAPTRWTAAVLPLLLLVATAACGDDDDGGGGGASGEAGSLQVMIGSSGEAETAAVTAAAERFTEDTGIDVEVIPAQDLAQQLTQGFAGGSPPDVFYVDPIQTQQFADSLYPYGSQIGDLDDFRPELVESYTIDGEVYCVPKDGGALALIVNDTAWQEAGLTEDDYPETWEDLATVAQTLTTGDQVGLAFNADRHIAGTFMQQAGGWFVNDDLTEATADTPENAEALAYMQDNLVDGGFRFVTQIEAGWGGEAFGTGKAAMTIEGPWIIGALATDYPDIDWTAVELPAGPAGPGTMQFSNCWGVAADSSDTDAAVQLVEHLTSAEEQQAFTEAFGPTPSRVSLEEWHQETHPEAVAFNAGVEYSRAPVPLPSFTSALDDFNSQLPDLGSGATTPEDVLARLQTNEEAALEEGA
jgi:multiple sugar transport system substrate-binding protein